MPASTIEQASISLNCISEKMETGGTPVLRLWIRRPRRGNFFKLVIRGTENKSGDLFPGRRTFLSAEIFSKFDPGFTD